MVMLGNCSFIHAIAGMAGSGIYVLNQKASFEEVNSPMKRIFILLFLIFLLAPFLSFEVGAQSRSKKVETRQEKVQRARGKLRKQLKGAAQKCWNATVQGLRNSKEVFNETMNNDRERRRKKKKLGSD